MRHLLAKTITHLKAAFNIKKDKNELCMKSVIALVGNHHETYVNYALELEKGFYIHKSHTYKNSHQAVTNQLTMGTWPDRLLSPVVLLKYHHYIYKTNSVTHMAANYLFIIMTVLHIHYLSLSVGPSSWSDADRRKWRGRWDWKLDCTLKDTRDGLGCEGISSNHLEMQPVSLGRYLTCG